jgi:hypothetical protein
MKPITEAVNLVINRKLLVISFNDRIFKQLPESLTVIDVDGNDFELKQCALSYSLDNKSWKHFETYKDFKNRINKLIEKNNNDFEFYLRLRLGSNNVESVKLDGKVLLESEYNVILRK